MGDYDALKLDNQLCFPLYAAARRVVSMYSPLLKPLGITYTQYIVFLVLWEEDGVSVGSLCRRLRLDNGTLTPLLKKMEDSGWVVRTRSREDERVVIVSLTERGAALRERVAGIPEQVGSCVGLSHDDAVALYRLLYRILDDERCGTKEA